VRLIPGNGSAEAEPGQAPNVPCFVLHHTGFFVPRQLPDGRWAFTPPFRPYPVLERAGRSVFCDTFRHPGLTSRVPAYSTRRVASGVFGLSSATDLTLYSESSATRCMVNLLGKAKCARSSIRAAIDSSQITGVVLPWPLLVPMLQMHSASEFLLRLRNAWDAGTFVKLTLSEPDGAEPGLRNLKARPVELKEGRRLCVLECFATREITRNYGPSEGTELLAMALGSTWRRAHLFTTAGDFQFRRERSGKFTIRTMRSRFTQTPSFQHDKVHPKQEALAAEPFLQRLGVTNALGRRVRGWLGNSGKSSVSASLLGHLLDDLAWKNEQPISGRGYGAGKGYLTFALARAFKNAAGKPRSSESKHAPN